MKTEFECHDHQRHTVQRAAHGDEGIALPRALLRGSQARRVLFLVAKAQPVDRLDVTEHLLTLLLVEEQVQAPAGAEAHVVIALRAHVGIALEVGAVQDGLALGAFRPHALGHGGAPVSVGTVDARGQNLVNPAHAVSL